jgi:hypothetical protein
MTLEDAGEDQIAHRQRRIERLARLLASCSVLSPSPRIRPCRRVAACRLSGRSSVAATGPERLVLGLVVAPMLERIFGDHRTGVSRSYDGLASSR